MATGTAACDPPLTLAEADALIGPHLGRPDARVILAVSGGPDSVALMHLCARLRAGGRPAAVVVATVDHGLRPEAGDEAEQVAAWAAEIALPHRILTWAGPHPASGLQARARAARYRLLADLAFEIGADEVLTAHTFDDQAETVLLRLFAGSGPGGLAGMARTVRLAGVRVARPLLGVPKARLLATCAAEGWPFLRDPSNDDARFGRVRLRRMMPELAREGLSSRRLVRLAGRMRRAEAALEAAAHAAFARLRPEQGPDGLALDGAGLRAEPDEIALRILALAILRVVGPDARLSLARLERLAELMRREGVDEGAGAKATLGGALLDWRVDGRLVVRRAPPRRAAPDAAAER